MESVRDRASSSLQRSERSQISPPLLLWTLSSAPGLFLSLMWNKKAVPISVHSMMPTKTYTTQTLHPSRPYRMIMLIEKVQVNWNTSVKLHGSWIEDLLEFGDTVRLHSNFPDVPNARSCRPVEAIAHWPKWSLQCPGCLRTTAPFPESERGRTLTSMSPQERIRIRQ